MASKEKRTRNVGARTTPSQPQPRNRTTSAAATRTHADVQSFDPQTVRPWRFHNRAGSGMDDLSIDALAESIKRSGQQQPGLARRLSSGDRHRVEAIFGVRRLEACRRAGVPWRAQVRDASLSDAQCAALMHSENAWTEGVSALENAVQWQAMLDEGVFPTQSALAAEIGCHRGTVARAVRTARALFAEEWLARLVRPVMHEFSGRAARPAGRCLCQRTAPGAGAPAGRALLPGTGPCPVAVRRPVRTHLPGPPLADGFRSPPRPGRRWRGGGRTHPAQRRGGLVGHRAGARAGPG